MNVSFKSKLESIGIFLTDEGLIKCIEEAEIEDDIEQLRLSFLNLDMKEICSKRFPDDFGRNKQATCPKFPLILQISDIVNVLKSERNQEDGDSKKRMLLLKLSDGHCTCNAFELEPLQELSVVIPPGSKLLFEDVKFSDGFFLLDRRSKWKFLGGIVPSLFAAWKARTSIKKGRQSLLSFSEGGPPPFREIVLSNSSSSHSSISIQSNFEREDHDQKPHIARSSKTISPTITVVYSEEDYFTSPISTSGISYKNQASITNAIHPNERHSSQSKSQSKSQQNLQKAHRRTLAAVTSQQKEHHKLDYRRK